VVQALRVAKAALQKRVSFAAAVLVIRQPVESVPAVFSNLNACFDFQRLGSLAFGQFGFHSSFSFLFSNYASFNSGKSEALALMRITDANW
jgi:hypothetical protein